MGAHDIETAEEVLNQLQLWFEDYNENHPHRGLKMRSPREFRRQEATVWGSSVLGGNSSTDRPQTVIIKDHSMVETRINGSITPQYSEPLEDAIESALHSSSQ